MTRLKSKTINSLAFAGSLVIAVITQSSPAFSMKLIDATFQIPTVPNIAQNIALNPHVDYQFSVTRARVRILKLERLSNRLKRTNTRLKRNLVKFK